MEDLTKLPEDSYEKRVLARRLVMLHLELKERPRERSPEEEEFVMTGEQMLQELETKARGEGREAGRDEGAQQMVRTLYETRFGAMPQRVSERLETIRDMERLKCLIKACATEPARTIQGMIAAELH